MIGQAEDMEVYREPTSKDGGHPSNADAPPCPFKRIARPLPLSMTAIALFFTAGGGSAAMAESVRLWPSAVVDGDTVRLDEVARLEGFDERAHDEAAGLIVAPAPAPGGKSVITIDAVRNKLRGAGLNMATMLMGGAMECQVARPLEVVPSAPRNPTTDIGAAGAKEAPTSQPAGLTLEQTIHRHFARKLAYLGGEVSLSFAPRQENLLSLREPDHSFALSENGADSLGAHRLRVQITALDLPAGRHGGASQTVTVNVQVAVEVPILVACTSISRGEAIKDAHLLREVRRFTRAADIGITDPQSAIGREAKWFIPRGSAIDARQLEEVPLVRRGEFVRVRVIGQGFTVVTTGKALGDGKAGDQVEVSSERSKETFLAVVVGLRSVERQLNPAIDLVSPMVVPVAAGAKSASGELSHAPHDSPLGSEREEIPQSERSAEEFSRAPLPHSSRRGNP